ncbi:MAG: glutathione S-transferase [Phenylobacterium sp.]|uniref:glutathione S-transferase N-terminal domain-containing protein n=1 Tax=Phenylobacterium sp. TaxID=1871053 RepID=UPI0025E6877A|nr:glutathione S-transferase N-terminal domain-containing protein [Phenylobacterium sp.]MBI1197995.1 glutathione S-transferase [Phenylobacterium sp.]
MARLEHYRILGGLGSPYSMKMRAIMRYRRLPYVWIQINDSHDEERAQVKPAVIPVIQYPDGSYHNDSTPMIYDLEARHPDDRGIVPHEVGDAFLAYLLEDMADEWGTKLMFHYRWFLERDQVRMSEWLAYDRAMGGGFAGIKQFADFFRSRQVGRMALVGCTRQNAPVIEESARRLAAIFEAHVLERPFLFGSRPSLAEFGWYGQFSQLIVDPTPNDLLREIAPFTVRWLMHLDDASGVDGSWRKPDEALAPAVEKLLAFAGEVYFPFLEANARALRAGEETFTVELLGKPYTQGAFKYQARCLESLRRAYADLPPAVRPRIDAMLSKAGVLGFLTASQPA